MVGRNSSNGGLIMEIITRQEAKEQGLTHYYTGKPCNKGHISKYYVRAGKCFQCIKEKQKKWRAENQERYLESQKKLYQKNRQQYMARAAKWSVANKEKRRDICRKYYREHWDKEKKRKQNYNAKNPEKIASRTRFYQARKRHATLKSFTPKDFENIYKERDRMTKATGIEHHVDHIIPLQGENVCGLHVPWNLQVMLARDNIIKSNKWACG